MLKFITEQLYRIIHPPAENKKEPLQMGYYAFIFIENVYVGCWTKDILIMM